MLGRFVSEGVLIPDSSCDFASPLVIVNKNDDGICMAVDCREVNMQLKTTANQLPYQRLGGQNFYTKVDNPIASHGG